MNSFLGIDLGGTKIEAIVLANGVEQFRRRVATPQGDYKQTLGAITALVNEAAAACEYSGAVGIGTPGAISPASGLIKNSNSVCLNGRNLRQDLQTALRRPVRIANDADCFALSEARDGAAAGFDTVFGVILGTGTGGGLVCHGSLLQGPNAIAGEWGHNPLPWPTDDERPGPDCYCGKQGCIETWLSGPGLSTDYQRTTGDVVDAIEIASRVMRAEQAANAVLERYVDRLARALAGVINILDPGVIVLGGGLSNIDVLYEELPHRLPGYVFSDRVDTVIRKAQHGDSSGVRGAAWLVSQ